MLTTNDLARHFKVDPSWVRRWPAKGCPTIHKGSKGRGKGHAFESLEKVTSWLKGASASFLAGASESLMRFCVPSAISTDAAMDRISVALRNTVEHSSLEIRTDVSKADASALMLIVWDNCCQAFGKKYRTEDLPAPIRDLYSYFVGSSSSQEDDDNGYPAKSATTQSRRNAL